jgi:hypothetical protein
VPARRPARVSEPAWAGAVVVGCPCERAPFVCVCVLGRGGARRAVGEPLLARR